MEELAALAAEHVLAQRLDEAKTLLLTTLRAQQGEAARQFLEEGSAPPTRRSVEGVEGVEGVADAGRVAERQAFAACLALLARVFQLQRGPPGQTEALCECSLALDEGNGWAKVVLARRCMEQKRFGQAIFLAGLVTQADRASAEAAGHVLQASREAQEAWMQAHVSGEKELDALRAGLDASPIKTLRGVGKKTAEAFETGESTTVRQAADEIKGKGSGIVGPAKRKLFQEADKALSPNSQSHKSPAAEQFRAVRLLLSPERAGAPTLVVGSWNAMATRPEHGVTVGMLTRKADNLARVAEERGMALLVVQECPGAFLRHEGNAAARRALEPGQTMKDLLLARLNRAAGCREYQAVSVTVPCVQKDGADQGETHCLVWDKHTLQLEDADSLPRLLLPPADSPPSLAGGPTAAADAGGGPQGDLGGSKEGGPRGDLGGSKEGGRRFHRAPVLARFRFTASPDRRMAVVSVHLKSGGGPDTAAEVRRLGTHAAAEVLREMEPSGKDCILVVGDFNLAPTDPAFDGLRGAGFSYVGDGQPTNQGEWLRGRQGHVYDSAWLWRAEGGRDSGTAGEVVQQEDMRVALADRERLAELLAQWQPSSRFAGELKQELIGRPGQHPLPNFVVDLFKRKVMADWSDHKPIAVSIQL